MAGKFVSTLGDESGLPGFFNGPFIKGQREPRIAIVGRSNVGKSSLINELLGGTFAQTSKSPGKTRAIHFYLWNEARKIIADLPGYGHANASKTERERWNRFIAGYFETDSELKRVALLWDSRHGPTKLDLEALEFFRELDIPQLVVFTKTDQLKTQSERATRRKEASLALEKLGYNPSEAFWCSSKSRDGIPQLASELEK